LTWHWLRLLIVPVLMFLISACTLSEAPASILPVDVKELLPDGWTIVGEPIGLDVDQKDGTREWFLFYKTSNDSHIQGLVYEKHGDRARAPIFLIWEPLPSAAGFGTPPIDVTLRDIYPPREVNGKREGNGQREVIVGSPATRYTQLHIYTYHLTGDGHLIYNLVGYFQGERGVTLGEDREVYGLVVTTCTDYKGLPPGSSLAVFRRYYPQQDRYQEDQPNEEYLDFAPARPQPLTNPEEVVVAYYLDRFKGAQNLRRYLHPDAPQLAPSRERVATIYYRQVSPDQKSVILAGTLVDYPKSPPRSVEWQLETKDNQWLIRAESRK